MQLVGTMISNVRGCAGQEHRNMPLDSDDRTEATAGMRAEPESAKRTRQPDKFDKQLFRMAPFGRYQMTQGCGSRVHRVQDPKIGNFASEEFRAARRAALSNSGSLLLKNFDQSAPEQHQPLAGADLKYWRNEMWIVGEVAGPSRMTRANGRLRRPSEDSVSNTSRRFLRPT